MEIILRHLKNCLALQLKTWPAARKAFDNLANTNTRVISDNGLALQYNSARILSTTADINPDHIAERNCFLCKETRPEQQIAFELDSEFELLVNPYPIVRDHFCVVSRQHRPQLFKDCYKEMIKIASWITSDYMVFYNGPHSGASAPDHLHMQIGRGKGIPLVETLRKLVSDTPNDSGQTVIRPFGFPITVLRQATPERLWSLVTSLPVFNSSEDEPRMNVLAINCNGERVVAVIPRGKHRPDCYYESDEEQILVSPGAIDMFGLVITPYKKDFDSLTEEQVLRIYSQVTPGESMIKVGIMAAPQIDFCLNDAYSDGNCKIEGGMSVSIREGKLCWNGLLVDQITLTPHDPEGTFTLQGVSIGIGFHWERQESQTFNGTLMLIIQDGLIHAINILHIDDYLASVISSEMKPTAPMEFLKAHAVISRSWVLAQINNRNRPTDNSQSAHVAIGLNRMIRWYDHQQHTLFDVCADDHCQRYQGRTRIISQAAIAAVEATAGQILTHQGELCDARFSKCCGGVTEQFETCWQESHKPYLVALRDNNTADNALPDLTDEKNARQWIMNAPNSFCSSASHKILAKSLNGYDLETPNYYRWRVEYSQAELTNLFRQKSNLDIGLITNLIPIRRGPSGRIYELSIQGTHQTITVGKELEIRRLLSPTHLLSSAFVVDIESTPDGTPLFILHGAGWGHGVGLCQIGAAMMAEQGYSYTDILEHYYPGTTISHCY